MRNLILFFAICSFLVSCKNVPSNETQEETSTTESLEVSSAPGEIYGIESAYVKYRTNAVGQEMIRELWFDGHGNRQYEENTMEIMGNKSGTKSLVLDGWKYQWDIDSNSGTKSKFYQSVTDYDKVSEKEIERYGIQKHGYETIAGKNCLKVTTEKPAKSTSWIWENIPLKTEAVFAGNQVLVEVVEIKEGNVDPDVFKLPDGVTFTEPE
ncbi:MAG: hypothetical protein EOM06_01085 [Sphingobacteriia bacterium]|nr:hypothetical protein [Sphingobacteriia bacterium]